MIWKNRTKKDIEELVLHAKRRLSLDDWQIDIKFSDKNYNDNDGRGCLADTSTSDEYLKAVITVYPIISKYSFKELKPVIFHEVSHCLTAEMYHHACNRYADNDQIIRAHERLTQRISLLV